MKTAIYIEDGVMQVVLTPEEGFELETFRKFVGQTLQITAHEGSFYDTRGGWVRQSAYQDQPSYPASYDRKDVSFIVHAKVHQPDPLPELSPFAALDTVPAIKELVTAALAAVAADDLSSRIQKRLEKAAVAVESILDPQPPF